MQYIAYSAISRFNDVLYTSRQSGGYAASQAVYSSLPGLRVRDRKGALPEVRDMSTVDVVAGYNL